MTHEEIDMIKKSIDDLNLFLYYNSLRDNSVMLWKAKKAIRDDSFYEDGMHIDYYDPNAYRINIYLIHDEDKMYIGNEQIPMDLGMDNKQKTANLIEYWFRGNSSDYVLLYEYVGVHNKSINKRGYGCNQGTLDVIKKKVIDAIKANLNVNNISDIDYKSLSEKYGKTISIYKANTRKILKQTPIEDFSQKIIDILDDIEANIIPWMNILYEKNRYWFISENEQDKNDVEQFMSKYALRSKGDYELYKAVLIIFKEYLLWQACEYYEGEYYKTIFSKKDYIRNPKCTAHQFYDWKKMWDNSKPINLILSICYKYVYPEKVIQDKSYYKKFRNKLYKNINNKKL